MARTAQGMFLLSLLVVSFWAQTQASVVVWNYVGSPVFVNVAGTNVNVVAGVVPVYIDVQGKKEQNVVVSIPGAKGKKAQSLNVNVKDGDTLVFIPEVLGGGLVNVNVNGIFKGHL